MLLLRMIFRVWTCCLKSWGMIIMAYMTSEERARQAKRRKTKTILLVVLIVLILLGILTWFFQHSIITIVHGQIQMVSLIF